MCCPGPLEGAALARQWARTDLLLLPSTTETYGMVVTEALAHGVPAVVAAGTGAVEALDGTPGPRGAPDTGVPSGAGLGVRYHTPIGPIRADVGVPLVKQRDSSAFGLYVGIGQAF